MNRGNDAVDIEELRQELNRLRIAAKNIERLITAAEDREEQEQPEDRRPGDYPHTHPVVRDRDGKGNHHRGPSNLFNTCLIFVRKWDCIQNLKQRSKSDCTRSVPTKHLKPPSKRTYSTKRVMTQETSSNPRDGTGTSDQSHAPTAVFHRTGQTTKRDDNQDRSLVTPFHIKVSVKKLGFYWPLDSKSSKRRYNFKSS